MRVLITAGPTRERIDPVRYLSNNSSGKQGYAIARQCQKMGWDVTLVSGPVSLVPPEGVKCIPVESADEMLQACELALPVDIAICVAAVCDWKPENVAMQKLKKQPDVESLEFKLVKNPDILQHLSQHQQRPSMVVGFAAETENLLENAREKLTRKGCDVIVANHVDDTQPVFGADHNQVTVLDRNGGQQRWEPMSKADVAEKLVAYINKRN